MGKRSTTNMTLNYDPMPIRKRMGQCSGEQRGNSHPQLFGKRKGAVIRTLPALHRCIMGREVKAVLGHGLPQKSIKAQGVHAGMGALPLLQVTVCVHHYNKSLPFKQNIISKCKQDHRGTLAQPARTSAIPTVAWPLLTLLQAVTYS